MKNLVFLFLMIAASAGLAFGQKGAAGGGKPDPKKAVEAAFDRLVEGIKQVDADKVVAAYANGREILIFNNNGTATGDFASVESNIRSSFAKLKNVTLEITGRRIEMLGPSSAYVTCKWRQQQENDGKLEDASGRMTLIFRLIGKEWKIVHRHTSPDRPDATRPLFPSERVN